MKPAAVEPLSPSGPVAPQLYRQLRARIVSCELAPGARISETDIAKTYAVSRQPVREAFIKLADEQLVSIRPQRGTSVQRISVRAALTARFIREAVEADLVRRVAAGVTATMLDALRDQIAQQQAAARSDNPNDFMRLDELFHRTLARYAGKPDVSDYLEGLNVQMNRVRAISARQFSPVRLIAQHTEIVDAIAAGDGGAADDAMRRHLQEIKNDLPRIVRAYPDYFDDIEALEQL